MASRTMLNCSLRIAAASGRHSLADQLPSLLVQRPAVPPPRHAADVAAGVQGDAENPCAGVVNLDEVSLVLPTLDERLLQGVARVLRVAHNVIQHPQQFVLMARKRLFEPLGGLPGLVFGVGPGCGQAIHRLSVKLDDAGPATDFRGAAVCSHCCSESRFR